MKNYETVFIVTPVLSEGDIKKTVAKYTETLKKGGAEIINEEHWGLKQLAYPIQKKTTGIYHLVEYKCETDLIAQVEIDFKRDEDILRFLTVGLNKYAVEYNDRRKNGLIGRKKDVEKQEAVQ
ncbi:MAG: 30S ribosomal protein S6 [Bacteroidetes bacterium]|nr:30S ribosomal protein S6 [Bacteroidota bacterium]